MLHYALLSSMVGALFIGDRYALGVSGVSGVDLVADDMEPS